LGKIGKAGKSWKFFLKDGNGSQKIISIGKNIVRIGKD